MRIGLAIWPKENARWWKLALAKQFENHEIIRMETQLEETGPVEGVLLDGDHPGPGFVLNYHRLTKAHPVPVLVVMGAPSAPALMNMEWDPDWTRFIPKPAPIEPSVAALERLIHKKLRETQLLEPEEPEKLGYLAHLHLADLLQMLCQSNWTGRIEVKHVSAGESGQIYVKSGVLWHAELRDNAGLNACYEMLTWMRCRYVFDDDALHANGRSITIPCQEVVLEGARRIDHQI